MLFSARIQEIDATLLNYNQQISDLQDRLEKLREDKKQLENHAQQLGSAQSAAESSLEQIRTALVMVRAIAPTEVATFKAAIDKLFSSYEELPELPQEKTEVETPDGLSSRTSHGLEETSTSSTNGHKSDGVALVIETEVEEVEDNGNNGNGQVSLRTSHGLEETRGVQGDGAYKLLNEIQETAPAEASSAHSPSSSPVSFLTFDNAMELTVKELKVIARHVGGIKLAQKRYDLAQAIADNKVEMKTVTSLLPDRFGEKITFMVSHHADENAREESAATILGWAKDEGYEGNEIEKAIAILNDIGDVTISR